MSRKSGAGHSHTLDLLRGLSALAVVMLHLENFAELQGDHIPLHEVGELGVQMFFVLSGFFIGTSVLAPRAFDSVDYGVNRFLRIVPNYLFSLMVVILLIDPAPLLTVHGWGDTLTHVFFVQGWFIDYRVSISPVLWTLSVEWMFYLFMLAAAGLIRSRRTGWWVAFGMVAVALVYRVILWRHAQGDAAILNLGYKQLPGMFDLFACGLIVALLLQHERARRWAARPRVKLVGVVLALAGLVAASAVFRWSPPPEYYSRGAVVILFPLAFAIPAAALILFFQQYESSIGPMLDRSRLAFIGVISYSIYLYHLVVIQAFNRATKSSGERSSLYVILALVAVFAVAIAAYYLVEKPFMDRRSRVREWMHARLAGPRSELPRAPTGAGPEPEVVPTGGVTGRN